MGREWGGNGGGKGERRPSRIDDKSARGFAAEQQAEDAARRVWRKDIPGSGRSSLDYISLLDYILSAVRMPPFLGPAIGHFHPDRYVGEGKRKKGMTN